MSQILTSIHGRAVGLDKDGYLTARIGAKFPSLSLGVSGSEVVVDIAGATTVTAATSATTGTSISARGITTVSSAATNWVIDSPVTGVRKVLTTISTSTAARIVSRGNTGFTFQSSEGSTMAKVTFSGQGGAITLIGLSTTLYGVIARTSTDTVFTGSS